ncbi:baculoviral iap repeat-containing protein 3, partial [Plakobranchus ocellatus]
AAPPQRITGVQESTRHPSDLEIHFDIDLRYRRFWSSCDRIRRRNRTCRTCLRNEHPVQHLNWPCGHLINCNDCVPLMHRCPCCYRTIERVILWSTP